MVLADIAIGREASRVLSSHPLQGFRTDLFRILVPLKLHDGRPKIDDRLCPVHDEDEQHRARTDVPIGFALAFTGIQHGDVENKL